uniref:DH domain-containing protein n=1 Tax=Megaselia scalaris TaxID=36166 RepID=T1GVQ7_MEGSC
MNESLGDVFLKAFSQPQVLEIYSGFINNFSAAMELAKMEAKRKSALADFFKVKQISAHDRLSFFGLMVKPVQRFPQFILFLQDLLKNTPQGHHDRTSLQLALTQLESLAEMLNERKREAEQYQAFKEMLGHISGTFNTRSFSSASHKGASDLGNISEMMSAEIHEEKLTKDEETQQMAPAAATLKRQKNKANAAANSKNSPNSEGPTTVITLMGGRGYWKHVWYNSSGTSPSTGKNNSSSNSRFVNSNDAHIVIWEKKL